MSDQDLKPNALLYRFVFENKTPDIKDKMNRVLKEMRLQGVKNPKLFPFGRLTGEVVHSPGSICAEYLLSMQFTKFATTGPDMETDPHVLDDVKAEIQTVFWTLPEMEGVNALKIDPHTYIVA